MTRTNSTKGVYLDSCTFIRWLAKAPGADAVGHLFELVKREELTILTSVWTMTEVLYFKPRDDQKNSIAQIRSTIRELFNQEWIKTYGVSRAVAERAQDVFWDYGIKPKDCVHLATVMVFDITTFYTYDEKLVKKIKNNQISTNKNRLINASMPSDLPFQTGF